MSKICIGVLTGNTLDKKQVGNLIEEHLQPYGLTAFFELSYTEPFLEDVLNKSPVIFSIADDHKYDNCEMFLLPDNCSINGEKNTTPFCERIKILESLTEKLLKCTSQIDIFAGDSGLDLCDFESYHISIDDFPAVFRQLNCVKPLDIHIMLDGH